MTDLAKSFVAGWMGGIGNLLVGHPFDTIKTLMQSAPKGTYSSSADCLTKLVKAEGPLAVYKGVRAPMTGVGVVFAIYFLAYDATESVLRRVKGMNATQNLSLAEVMICGGSTGVFGSLILGPAELIKIRQQTASSKGLDGSFGGVVRAIRGEGIFGFFRGMSATMIRDVPGSMAWFGAYEMTKQALCENPKNPGVFQALVAGGMGGLGMWSFAIPLDAIKTRVQASSGSSGGAIGAARAIFKEHGMKGFYRGIGPALLRAFPANAATFAAKEMAQSAMDKAF